METLFDIEEVLARFDGDRDMLNEVIQLFLEDYPNLVSEVRAAIARKDAAALHRSAHALKGSVSNFSAPAADAAYSLEKMGRSDSLTGAEEAFQDLEGKLMQLIPTLASVVAEKAPA